MKSHDPKRRSFLRGALSAGTTVAATSALSVGYEARAAQAATATSVTDLPAVPFHGPNQAGVLAAPPTAGSSRELRPHCG
jgi:hypothetical protein